MAVEKKKKMGRPIKYTKEVVEKLADDLLEFLYEEPFPFLNKFATKHMLSVDVFSANKNFTENEYFSKALKIYKQTFVTILIEGAATGGLVPSMVIFTLKNIAGWRDTPLIDMSTNITQQYVTYYRPKKTERKVLEATGRATGNLS